VLVMATLLRTPRLVLVAETALLATAVAVPVGRSQAVVPVVMLLVVVAVVAHRHDRITTAAAWTGSWGVPLAAALLFDDRLFPKPTPPMQAFAQAAAVGALSAASIGFGRYLRWRQRAAGERAAQAASHKALKARADLLAERTHLARELHDTLAHHIGAITLRASSAKLALDSGAGKDVAAEALDDVAATGRRVLVELRELLSMLRDPEAADGDGLLPDPEAAMTAVVQRMRAAGLPIDVEIDARFAQVSTLVRVTVARVVGEALTNVLKHAGPGTPSLVKVVVTPPESLRAHISNDKPTRAIPSLPQSLPRSGHGLTGMRERVALLGGVLCAGPTPDDGWAVTVDLPARMLR